MKHATNLDFGRGVDSAVMNQLCLANGRSVPAEPLYYATIGAAYWPVIKRLRAAQTAMVLAFESLCFDITGADPLFVRVQRHELSNKITGLAAVYPPDLVTVDAFAGPDSNELLRIMRGSEYARDYRDILASDLDAQRQEFYSSLLGCSLTDFKLSYGWPRFRVTDDGRVLVSTYAALETAGKVVESVSSGVWLRGRALVL